MISVPDSGNAGRERLRARLRPAQGRRADQEPLRRADLHPAGPGAAQARPADEVQPAARDRLRQAGRRRRRLDRPRQHDPPDHRHAARRRRDARSTCGSRRRRSATPATTGSTCRPREEMIAHDRTVEEIAARDRRRLARLPVARGRLRGGRDAARGPLRRLLHRRLPARRRRRGERQVRARAAARRAARRLTPSGASLRRRLDHRGDEASSPRRCERHFGHAGLPARAAARRSRPRSPAATCSW